MANVVAKAEIDIVACACVTPTSRTLPPRL